jgi:predicted nucleic acid-binding protein
MIGADTTFLIELEIVESPSHASAHRILQDRIIKTGVPLAVAPQTLAEFLHIVTDPRRFKNPLPMSEAIRRARNWWNASEVRRLTPDEASVPLCLEWMEKFQLGRKRILDTQLAAAFWRAGIRKVCTSNPSDFDSDLKPSFLDGGALNLMEIGA